MHMLLFIIIPTNGIYFLYHHDSVLCGFSKQWCDLNILSKDYYEWKLAYSDIVRAWRGKGLMSGGFRRNTMSGKIVSGSGRLGVICSEACNLVIKFMMEDDETTAAELALTAWG